MPAKKTLRTRVVKTLWRLLTPKHPRGWIDIDWEEQGDQKLRVFTEGLARFDLPDLEICDCDPDQVLLGYCHGVIFIAIGALQLSQKDARAINDGDILDLRAIEEEQQVVVRLGKQRDDLFRLMDQTPEGDRFPATAMANYILNAAEKMTNPVRVLEAADLATQIHAKDFAYAALRPDEDTFAAVVDASNARAYYTLADALHATGQEQEALAALEEAVARAPFMAEIILQETNDADRLQFPVSYLASVDPWEVQKRFRESLSG